MSLLPGLTTVPPMLDKSNYNSWASRMLLYLEGKDHGKLLVDSVLNGSFQYETIVEPGDENTPATVRPRTYTNLTEEEKLRESIDIKATNIVLQALPQDIYNLRESKLYDDFDMFTSTPGETIHWYYMRFTQLINDMHTIGMTMKPMQVNTKFINHLQLEWSKFVIDVKLAKDMHSSNFYQLHAYLRQHEAHENEYYPQLSNVSQPYYSPPAPQRPYDAPMVQQSEFQPQAVTHSPVVHQQPYQAPALQQSYQAPTLQQTFQAPAVQQPLQISSTELDSGLVSPSFNPSDDPIANLNKLMAFVTSAFYPRFPQINNQLRTSSNPRNQATIQDGRVTVQIVQGRLTQGIANNGVKNNATN
ncbi:hypothetical protein Tco_0174131 [Tanacetum coccineum]